MHSYGDKYKYSSDKFGCVSYLSCRNSTPEDLKFFFQSETNQVREK